MALDLEGLKRDSYIESNASTAISQWPTFLLHTPSAFPHFSTVFNHWMKRGAVFESIYDEGIQLGCLTAAYTCRLRIETPPKHLSLSSFRTIDATLSTWIPSFFRWFLSSSAVIPASMDALFATASAFVTSFPPGSRAEFVGQLFTPANFELFLRVSLRMASIYYYTIPAMELTEALIAFEARLEALGAGNHVRTISRKLVDGAPRSVTLSCFNIVSQRLSELRRNSSKTGLQRVHYSLAVLHYICKLGPSFSDIILANGILVLVVRGIQKTLRYLETPPTPAQLHPSWESQAQWKEEMQSVALERLFYWFNDAFFGPDPQRQSPHPRWIVQALKLGLLDMYERLERVGLRPLVLQNVMTAISLCLIHPPVFRQVDRFMNRMSFAPVRPSRADEDATVKQMMFRLQMRWERFRDLFESVDKGACMICWKCRTPHARQLCGGCKTALYCSDVCQQNQWKEHREMCQKLSERYHDGHPSPLTPARWELCFFDAVIRQDIESDYSTFYSKFRDQQPPSTGRSLYDVVHHLDYNAVFPESQFVAREDEPPKNLDISRSVNRLDTPGGRIVLWQVPWPVAEDEKGEMVIPEEFMSLIP